MTPQRTTRSGGRSDANRRAMQYLQSPSPTPKRDSRRSCAKRKIRYNDSDEESDDDLRRKRFRRGGSSDTELGDEVESPISSPQSCPSPKPTTLRRSMEELKLDPLYVQEDGADAELFRSLPVEIHQKIATYIETDRDVARYGSICKATTQAICDNVWRERCERLFDVVPTPALEVVENEKTYYVAVWPEEASQLYKTRQIDTSCYITFDRNVLRNLDDESKEMQWFLQNKLLEQMKDMILDSNAKKITENGRTKIVGKNFDFIRKLTSSPTPTNEYFDVLDNVLEEDLTIRPQGVRYSEDTKATTLILVQLCLAPLILGPDTCKSPVFHFDDSQRVVYSNARNSLFTGKFKSKVNLKLVLNTLNFFKFHLKAGNGEGVLGDAYKRLDSDQYPQLWAGEIPVGTQPLTGHWKGVSVFLDPKDLRLLRDRNSGESIFCDAVDDENLLDITFFSDQKIFGPKHWPETWDTFMDSDPYSSLDNPPTTTPSKKPKNGKSKKSNATTTPNSKKSQAPRTPTSNTKPKPSRPEVKEFWGTSRGHKTGHMFGRIHSVSNQHDIHGWQRVTMLKCFEKKGGGFDEHSVWMYEGVVLPGGRMIIGRWSHPYAELHENPDDCDSGPFIFWNVDRSTAVPGIDEGDAWEFGKKITDDLFTGLFF